MADSRKSIERIKVEIEKLKEKLKRAESLEAERLGSLAIKAGLHQVDASDTEILEGLRTIAGRFQNTAQTPSKAD